MSNDVANLLPSSSQAGEPARKRPRLSDTDDSESSPKNSAEPETKTEVVDELSRDAKTAIRDDTYYFSDGSCIMMVEDTLFNVRCTPYTPCNETNFFICSCRSTELSCLAIPLHFHRCSVFHKVTRYQKGCPTQILSS